MSESQTVPPSTCWTGSHCSGQEFFEPQGAGQHFLFRLQGARHISLFQPQGTGQKIFAAHLSLRTFSGTALTSSIALAAETRKRQWRFYDGANGGLAPPVQSQTPSVSNPTHDSLEFNPLGTTKY